MSTEQEIQADPQIDNALREVRKLIDILNKYGNTLVPQLGGKDTTAQERLKHFVGMLTESGLSVPDIESRIAAL